MIIPPKTQVVGDRDGVTFQTLSSAEIPAGELDVLVLGGCTKAGALGNDFLPGQLKKIVSPFPYRLQVVNTTTSSCGADIENDENLRERIQLAPESFSIAGPRGAYEFWAKTAHQDIIDVAVIGPPELEPGNVEIYPLMAGGVLPSQEILDTVYATCNAEDIRPLTDYVRVLFPTAVPYDLNVKYWVDRSRTKQSAGFKKSIEAAAEDWIRWGQNRLGRDINPSELTHRMIAAGAKRFIGIQCRKCKNQGELSSSPLFF